MNDESKTLAELKHFIRDFSAKRDWDQFHNAKELAIGISNEANELLQIFRFKSEEQVDALFENPDVRNEIQKELADVLSFTLLLAARYDIDLSSSLINKMAEVETKYPVDKVKGINLKYHEY